MFEIIEEQIAYKRYLTFKQRKVKFPNGKTFDWDVVGHSNPKPTFAIVFPFHSINVNLGSNSRTQPLLLKNIVKVQISYAIH